MHLTDVTCFCCPFPWLRRRTVNLLSPIVQVKRACLLILCALPHRPHLSTSHMYTLKPADLNDVKLVVEGRVGTAELVSRWSLMVLYLTLLCWDDTSLIDGKHHKLECLWLNCMKVTSLRAVPGDTVSLNEPRVSHVMPWYGDKWSGSFISSFSLNFRRSHLLVLQNWLC